MTVAAVRAVVQVALALAGLVLIGWGVWRAFGPTPVLIGGGLVLLAMGWTMDVDGVGKAASDGEPAA